MTDDQDSGAAYWERRAREAEQELICARVGAGHFRSERDIHFKETETFVTESAAKIEELAEKLNIERELSARLANILAGVEWSGRSVGPSGELSPTCPCCRGILFTKYARGEPDVLFGHQERCELEEALVDFEASK